MGLKAVAVEDEGGDRWRIKGRGARGRLGENGFVAVECQWSRGDSGPLVHSLAAL